MIHVHAAVVKNIKSAAEGINNKKRWSAYVSLVKNPLAGWQM